MTSASDFQVKNKRLSWKIALVAIGFFLFAFAQAPLYDRLCSLLGINNKGSVGMPTATTAAPIDRYMRMEFLSTVMPELSWTVQPKTVLMEIQPGKTYHTAYTAHNLTSQTLVSQAIPAISPVGAAEYLHKIQCFCFEQQTLKAGESRDMALIFTVSPDLPEQYKTMTLSYTFYKITPKEGAMPSS